ncbi:MAG: thiolase domain-containing protein, partial [Euryarchaeota archaeon]|nr:thiolase domain-containing protein [Euryarchaeota archaeon]
KFGRSPKTQGELMAEAGLDALMDAEVAPRDLQALFLGNFIGELTERTAHLGPLTAAALGIPGVPATRFENACASGSTALRHAIHSIQAGAYDTVLVGGTERVLNRTTPENTEYFSYAGDAYYETAAGITFPGHYALIARAHMNKHGTKPEHLAHVAVKNHKHGSKNPKAQIQKEIKLEDAMNSAMVADPLRLYDCCPFSDGAAAIILAGEKRAKEYDTPVWVAGNGQATDALAIHDRADMTRITSTEKAAQAAYQMAGTGPKDIDVVEVHDCFTIAEIVALEGLGFYPPGKGGPSAQNGDTYYDSGKIPCNTSGGLKAKGHPIGATGVAQVVEIVQQLRGQAHNQVKGAEIGMTHNVGGSGGTAVVHIFKR